MPNTLITSANLWLHSGFIQLNLYNAGFEHAMISRSGGVFIINMNEDVEIDESSLEELVDSLRAKYDFDAPILIQRMPGGMPEYELRITHDGGAFLSDGVEEGDDSGYDGDEDTDEEEVVVAESGPDGVFRFYDDELLDLIARWDLAGGSAAGGSFWDW
ncbi:MAG: hypothetical protein RLN62_04295 [Rickettsiales bacterium]